MPDTVVRHMREGDVSAPSGPDPHGQAALLLVESLLHTLVENDVLTAADALGAVMTAAEVKKDFAEAIGESRARLQASLELLARIRTSIALDAG